MAFQDSITNRTDDIPVHLVLRAAVRWRYRIGALVMAGALLGALAALTRPRTYSTDALFVPERSDQASQLALAVSRLGLSAPSTGGADWGPEAYVELLESRALLQPLCSRVMNDPRQPTRRITVGMLVSDSPNCTSGVVNALRGHIAASVIDPLSAVRVVVKTKWPQASADLASLVLAEINEFNLERRRSQASTEREFLQEQAGVADAKLRSAEERLQGFLQANRSLGNSPALTFEQDRLQGEVSLRRDMHATLLKNLEDARLREVRDVPVVSIIESPQRPDVPDSRHTLRTVVMGVLAAALLGAALVLLSFWTRFSAPAAESPAIGTSRRASRTDTVSI